MNSLWAKSTAQFYACFYDNNPIVKPISSSNVVVFESPIILEKEKKSFSASILFTLYIILYVYKIWD